MSTLSLLEQIEANQMTALAVTRRAIKALKKEESPKKSKEIPAHIMADMEARLTKKLRRA